MNKNFIKKLAEESFDKNKINQVKIMRISKSLKRADLKVYIKDLKRIEAKHMVNITIPKDEDISELKSYFSKVYPRKKIIFKIDSSLLTGIKVQDFDNIYELSLRNALEQSIKGVRND